MFFCADSAQLAETALRKHSFLVIDAEDTFVVCRVDVRLERLLDMAIDDVCLDALVDLFHPFVQLLERVDFDVKGDFQFFLHLMLGVEDDLLFQIFGEETDDVLLYGLENCVRLLHEACGYGLDDRFEQLGIWLKRKTGSDNDASFVNGFVSTSLTVGIGAMAIVGSIQDGILGDWSTLALKGALDAVIVCVMSASLGRGCVFSALPVAVIQGSITLLALPLRPIMTEAALANLSLVGSMLIFCVGVNLIWEKTFKPANMLPAVVIAVVWALVA